MIAYHLARCPRTTEIWDTIYNANADGPYVELGF